MLLLSLLLCLLLLLHVLFFPTTLHNSVSCKVSKTTWHQRLVHVSSLVLTHVLKSCSLPYSMNESVLFCDACHWILHLSLKVL